MKDRLRKAMPAVLLGVLVCLPAVMLLAPVASHAQVATMRNLNGVVTDKGGNKVVGAVVHLKDTRSLSQRSYITPADGTFRFGQLSSNSDYEVWATLNEKKTTSKSISSFDSKKDVDLELKLPN